MLTYFAPAVEPYTLMMLLPFEFTTSIQSLRTIRGERVGDVDVVCA